MGALSKNDLTERKPLATKLWQWDGASALVGCGARELLGLELTAFFASRQCPGVAIRAAMDWAVQQARAKRVVVSGFHSPLEQSVLKVLMAAGSPAVVVLARPVAGATLPPEWGAALAYGHMAVVSNVVKTSRLTQELAMHRNAVVVQLAQRVVVAHAGPGGLLAAQVGHWQQDGRLVDTLSPQ